MDFEETNVNGIGEGIDSEGLEDFLQEVVEEEEPEEPEESLDSLMEDEQPAAEGQKTDESQGTGGEPGWFKKRWDKEVGKLTAQIRNEIRNEYESQIAPMRERMLEMDAQELVRSGKVKDLETAKELVRYRQGQPQQPVQETGGTQRDAQGRFASQQAQQNQQTSDPATMARIDMLRHQADRIKESGGPDVIAAFRDDKEIHDAIIAGEMDFYDVADRLKAGSKKRPPSPTRTPNGVSGQIKGSIMSMSDEQFAKLEKRVREGGVRFRE